MDMQAIGQMAANEKDRAFKDAIFAALQEVLTEVKSLRAEVAELKAPRKTKE